MGQNGHRGYALTESEERFADLIWRHAPIPSPALAELAAQAFGWKRSTAYTMLKRLENKGVFANRNGVVHALVTPEEVAAAESARFVAKTFGGSLPRFVAAFTQTKPLTAAEVDELQRLIDGYREEQAG